MSIEVELCLSLCSYCCDKIFSSKSNLREKGFILSHDSRCSLTWQAGQGYKSYPQWAGRSSCLYKQIRIIPICLCRHRWFCHWHLTLSVTSSESLGYAMCLVLKPLHIFFSMSKEPTTSAFSLSYFLDCGLCAHPLSALITIVKLLILYPWIPCEPCITNAGLRDRQFLSLCFTFIFCLFASLFCCWWWWLVGFLGWDWTHRDLPTCVNATMPSWFLLVLYDFSAWQCLTLNLDKWGNMCAGVKTSFDSLSSAITYLFCLEMLESKHVLL